MPRIFWAILAATLAAWLGMTLWTVPQIEETAGGLRLLDMRLIGYFHMEVQDFVAAIGDDGTALYLGTQYWLDMVFPPLLGAVFFLFFRWLFPGLPGLIIGISSMTCVAADIFENLAVAAISRAGVNGLTPEMATTANQWTTVKWGLAIIGLLMLIIGVALQSRRRWFAPKYGTPTRSDFEMPCEGERTLVQRQLRAERQDLIISIPKAAASAEQPLEGTTANRAFEPVL